MKINWNGPIIQSLIHVIKVIVYIFVSGGLTALLNNVGQLHLDTVQAMILTGAINSAIAWSNKYVALRREEK